jgi:hypothetical protein
MFAKMFLSALLFVAAAGSTESIFGQSAETPQFASLSAYDPIASRTATTGVPEIHVDNGCRILPQQTTGVGRKAKPKPRKDSVICHLEGVLSSQHVERTIVAGVAHNSIVSVEEQEYVLQNVTTEPVVFVVEYGVPKGWRIDSDPQPGEMFGSLGIFRVNALAAQIVRLHVGMRHVHATK